MNTISDNPLKRAVDFINSGRLLGVPDTELLNCVISSDLTRDQFDAFIAWFHVKHAH